MKKPLKNIFRTGIAGGAWVMIVLLWVCSNLWLASCKKERLFTHIDSIGEVPSQFHFFNAFAYDSLLSLAVDGLPRENVAEYRFSKYYPSSSAFNLNSAQPNSKLINVNDPVVTTEFANLQANSTFQFKPNTSYLVLPTFPSYDTVSAPMKSIVPMLNYYPEDIYHPFDGTTGIRFFNSVGGNYGPATASITITPNVGQGTTATLYPVYTAIQPTRAADSYANTQAGQKKVVLNVNFNNVNIQLNYLPFQLEDGKNYSFFAVGDAKNFLNGIQPRPRLFVAQDGEPSSLKELTLSSLSYPGNLSTTAEVTVINDAYNIPGLLTFGDATQTNFVQYQGLDVTLNQSTINVSRWPIVPPDGPGPLLEDIGDGLSILRGTGPLNIMNRINTNSYLAPGAYSITVVPGGAFSPTYGKYSYNFQQGLAYTLCLLPDNTTSQQCGGALILENDNAPNNAYFKLRVINIMGGTTQLDVHNGSPSGPVIASAVSYGQQNDYIDLTPTLTTQNLYITAAGSTVPLFQTGTPDKSGPIAMPFRPGNSGTLYLMGLLPGTKYAGDPGSFGPYVYYHADAYINTNAYLPSSQLYY